MIINFQWWLGIIFFRQQGYWHEGGTKRVGQVVELIVGDSTRFCFFHFTNSSLLRMWVCAPKPNKRVWWNVKFCFCVRPCSRSKTPLYKPLSLIIYSCKYLKTPHHTLYVYVSYTYTHPSTMSLRYTLGPRRRSSRRLSPRRKFPKHFSYN